MDEPSKKGLELERLVFFSDAIVAIAITLLAFGLKVNVPAEQHITFDDLVHPWKTYLAFLLSFINIAGFWQTHHTIFYYVRKIDRRMMVLNLIWLFFIVVLPFTNSIISVHFPDKPAIVLYCCNILFIAIMQKFIWDYGDDEIAVKPGDEMIEHIDLMFTLDTMNAAVAVAVSFFYPEWAFILLFFKIPIFIFGTFYVASKRRKSRKVPR